MQQPSRFDMVRLGKQSKQNFSDKTTKKVHEEPAPKTHKVTKTEINLPNELEAIEWIPFQTFIGKKESVNLVGNVDYVDLYSQNQSLLTESPLMSVIVQCIHNLWNKRAVDIPKMLHHDLLANSERMNAKDNVSVSPKKKLRRSLYDIELSEAWTPWAYVKDYDKTVRLAHSKFAVVLYFMGAWRKFEVDDSVPIDKNLKPLLPVSSNNLWPILLCKAILMVLSSTSTFYQTTTDSLYLISKMILNLLTGTQIEMMPLNIYRTDDELWKLLLQSAELFISFQDSLSIIPQCVIDNDNVSVPIFVFGKNFSTNNLMLQIRDVNLTKLPKIDLPRWKYFRTTCADHEKEEYNNPLSRFVDILPPDNSWYFKSPSALSRKNSKSSIQGIMPTEYNSFSLKEFRESFDYLMMSNISEAFKYTYVNESSNLTDLPTGSPENPFMRSTNNIRSTIPHVYTDRTPIYSHHFKNAYDKIKVQETFISIVNETKDNNLLLITINTLPKLPTTKKTVIDEGQNIVGEAKLQKSAEKMHKEKRRGTIFPSKSRSKNSAYEINSFAILRLSPLFNHHEHYPFIIQYTSEKIFERKLETTYHEAKVLSIPVGVNYLRLRVESATDFVFSLSSNIPLNFLTLNMAIPKICEKTFVVNRIGNKLLKLTLNILDCYSLGNDSIGDAEHRLLNYISKHSSQKLYVKDRILLKFYLCLSKLFVEVVENGLAGKKGDGVNTNYSEVSDSPSFQEHVKYSLNSIFFSFRLYNPIIQKPYYETVNNCVGKLDKLFPNQMDYIRKPYLFTVLDSGHSDSDIASNDDASIYEDKKRIVKFDMLGNPLELKVENLKDYRMKSTPENQIAHTIFEKLTLEIHKNFDYYADQLFQYFVDELTLGDLRRQTAGLPAFEKYLKYFFVEPSKLFPSLTINAQKLHSFKLQGKTNLNVTVRTKVPDLFGTAIQLKLPGEDTTRLLSHSILYQTIFHSAFTKEEFSRLSEYFNGNIPHFYYYNLIVQCEFMSGSGDSTLSHVDSKIAKEKFNTIKGFLTIINNDNGLTLPNFGMINCPYFYPPNKFGYTFTICAYINPTVLSYCEDKGITSIMGNWSLTIISGTAIPLIIQNHWTSIREQEASIFTEFRASKDTTSRPPLPTNPEPILTSSMKLPKEKEVINNDTTDKKSKDKEPHPTKSKKKQRFRKDKKIVLENDDKESSSKRGGRTIPKRVESRAFIEEVFEDNRELVPFNYHTSIYNLTNILRNGKYVQEYARNPQYSIIEIPDIIFPDKPDTSVKKYLTILHDITISVHISLLDPTAVFELTILDNNKILRKQTGKGTMFMPGVFLCGNNNNRKANSFERSYDDSDELPSFYLTKATHKKPSQSSYGRRYTIKMRFLKPIKLTKEQTETLTKITNLKFNSVKASELFKPTLGPSPSEVPEGRFDRRQSKRNALLEIDFSLWYIRLIVNKTENKYLYVTRSADTIRKIFQFKFEVENMEPGRLKRAQEYRSKFNIETIKKIDKKKFYRPIRYLTAHLSDQIKSDAQYRRLKANKLKHYRYMKNEDFHMNFICRAISRTPSSIGETKIKNLVFETSSTD
ncbi:hypothetical protein SNEBB_009100 [Seison nebaliae]|nr:hypothetical protein SNEBB_009100 [Seison nebaliae]